MSVIVTTVTDPASATGIRVMRDAPTNIWRCNRGG